MCARYTLSKAEKEILAAYAAEVIDPFTPDIDVRITDESLVITADEPEHLKKMHFKLVPWTAASPKDVEYSTFNARSDKLMSSKMWRPLFVQSKRCLVIADGFYEMDKLLHPEGRQNYGFKLKDREIFAFAGLWSKWTSKDNSVAPYYSFAIITADSNHLVGEIHDKQRMPVILHKNDEAAWLSKDISPNELLSLMQPYPDDLMYRFKTGKITKKVKGPENSL